MVFSKYMRLSFFPFLASLILWLSHAQNMEANPIPTKTLSVGPSVREVLRKQNVFYSVSLTKSLCENSSPMFLAVQNSSIGGLVTH